MEIKATSLIKTCSSCPAQWEGDTDDGQQIYIRYRFGRFRFHLSEQGDDGEFAAINCKPLLSLETGNEYHGEMSNDEMLNLLKENGISLILPTDAPTNGVEAAKTAGDSEVE